MSFCVSFPKWRSSPCVWMIIGTLAVIWSIYGVGTSFREATQEWNKVRVWKLEIWRHFLRKIIAEASLLRLDIKNMFRKGNSKIYNFPVETEFKFSLKGGWKRRFCEAVKTVDPCRTTRLCAGQHRLGARRHGLDAGRHNPPESWNAKNHFGAGRHVRRGWMKFSYFSILINSI